MSADLHRLIAESLEDVVSLHDLEGRILYVTPSVGRLTGYTPDELVGKPGDELSHPDDRPRLRALAAEALFAGPPREVEFRLRTRDGGYRWVAARDQGLRGPDGEPFRVLRCARDITERKRAEDALRQSHDLLCAAADASPDAVSVKDRAGRYLLINAAGARRLGRPAEAVLGKDDAALFDPETARALRAADEQALTRGEVQTFEQTLRVAGAPRTFLVTVGPCRDARGRDLGVFAVARDVTERRAAEEQLRQAQKLEAVGRLAGGVAHDFNNLLTIITGYGSVLLEKHAPGDPEHEPLREVLRAAERAAVLTRQLLAFGRRQMLTPQVVDVNALILRLGEVLKRLLGPAVGLRLDLEPALARIKVDPGQLEQVLLDLAANARDAMPAGGELTLATANVPPAVRLMVRDTGRGMDADTLAHLFEPFFTTKEVGQGSGLGLATVHGTVAQCGGHIEAASTPGAGTTFTLTFPAAPAAPAAPGSGGQTILLVEDEHAVRALARHVLQSQGYTVLEARHAQEALDVHDRHGGPVHLLVSDVVLPHMTGPELARRLSARHPALRVLFLSGYPREALEMGPTPEGPRSRFLPKPFRPADLLHTVRELLEARD